MLLELLGTRRPEIHDRIVARSKRSSDFATALCKCQQVSAWRPMCSASEALNVSGSSHETNSGSGCFRTFLGFGPRFTA
jgi:hypothetical protein